MRILFFLLSFLMLLNGAYAVPLQRNSAFKTPAKLRGRVDFWIDVFSKYGKHQSVIHHRNFPQIVFTVVDMTAAGRTMSEIKFASFKKKKLKEETKKVEKALRNLSTGKAPATALEQRIVSRMHFIPGGKSKYSKVVKEKWIRSQTGIKEKYAQAIERSGRYMHIIEKIFVKDHGLPIELTRLPFVESSFDYKAYSSVGAAGIWQFMRRTGKYYMTINSYVDERRDIVSATHGAARYLKSAYKTLGNWPLALTSYNHGVAGVSRKVKKIGTKDLAKIIEHPTQRVFGFASTNFYPEFLAALDIYDYKKRFFPYTGPEMPLKIYSRKLKYPTSVSYVINKGRIPRAELERTNYGLTKNVWRGVYRIPKNYELKVPVAYTANLKSLKLPEPSYNASSSVYGGAVYTVRKGDTLGKIARRYKTSVGKLKKLNSLHGDMLVVGQRLVVREKSAKAVTTKSTKPAKGTYTVRSGDNLSSIASRHGISTTKLKSINGLRSSKIFVGQKLKLSGSGSTKSSSKSKVKWHKVRKGDSLWSISKRYGVSVSAIKRVNGLKGSTVKSGQLLKIP